MWCKKNKNALKYVGIFVFILVVTLGSFAQISENSDIYSPDDKINIRINLLSFEPRLGDVDARLEIRLPPYLIGKNYSPISDLYLIDLFSLGNSVFKLSSKKPFSIYDAVIKTQYQVDDAGHQFLYPFDKHHTKITFFVDSGGLSSNGKYIVQRMPLSYSCELCKFEGFDLRISKAKDYTDNFISLDIDIHRSSAVIFFSIFITIAMWLLGIIVFILAIRIAKRKEKPDMGSLSFNGSLLFAIPAVRYIQPMVPPIGILIDYLGFIWVEFLVIISLIIIVTCWIRRS